MAKYLGFFLGPAVDLHAWDGPLLKWETRVRAIAAAAAAPSIGASLGPLRRRTGDSSPSASARLQPIGLGRL